MRNVGVFLLGALVLVCATACPGPAHKSGAVSLSVRGSPDKLLNKLDERVRSFVLELNRVPDFMPLVGQATDGDGVVLVSLDLGLHGAAHHAEPAALREGSFEPQMPTTFCQSAITFQARR